MGNSIQEREPAGAVNYHLKPKPESESRGWLEKTVCDCRQHGILHRWPSKYAEITIPPCAIRCPYCNWKSRKLRQGAALRWHINAVHVSKMDVHTGLSVARWPIGRRGFKVPTRTPRSDLESEEDQKDSDYSDAEDSADDDDYLVDGAPSHREDSRRPQIDTYAEQLKSLARKREKLARDREKLVEKRERLNAQREMLTLEREKMARRREKLAREHEKLLILRDERNDDKQDVKDEYDTDTGSEGEEKENEIKEYKA